MIQEEPTIVKIKFLNDEAMFPYKGTPHSACWDVWAVSKEVLYDGKVIKYGLGIAVELPEKTQLDLRPRSSIWKTGLVLTNSVGTIDEDYRGEISAVFYNVVPELPDYEIGDRIGQIQVVDRKDVVFRETSKLSETIRGEGGFGSTGK